MAAVRSVRNRYARRVVIRRPSVLKESHRPPGNLLSSQDGQPCASFFWLINRPSLFAAVAGGTLHVRTIHPACWHFIRACPPRPHLHICTLSHATCASRSFLHPLPPAYTLSTYLCFSSSRLHPPPDRPAHPILACPYCPPLHPACPSSFPSASHHPAHVPVCSPPASPRISKRQKSPLGRQSSERAR